MAILVFEIKKLSIKLKKKKDFKNLNLKSNIFKIKEQNIPLLFSLKSSNGVQNFKLIT